jgi:hypothetical protein
MISAAHAAKPYGRPESGRTPGAERETTRAPTTPHPSRPPLTVVSAAHLSISQQALLLAGGPGRCFCFWRLLMVVVAGAGARRDGTSRAVARRTGEEDASGGVHGRPGYRGAVAGWQASSHLGCRAANPNGPLCVVRCRSLPHLAQQPNVGMLKLPTRREAGG